MNELRKNVSVVTFLELNDLAEELVNQMSSAGLIEFIRRVDELAADLHFSIELRNYFTEVVLEEEAVVTNE